MTLDDSGQPGSTVAPLRTTMIVAATFLLIVAGVGTWHGVRMSEVTRDVAAIGGLHPLSGLLSNAGLLLWCAAASISMFAGIVAMRLGSRLSKFLIASAAVSLLLLLDDMFQIHEDLARRHLGIDEKAVVLVIGLGVLSYLASYWRAIVQTKWQCLALAVALLVGSVSIDVALEQWLWRIGHWTYLVEDGLKWLGIAGWAHYHIETAASTLYVAPRKVG